MQTLYFSSNISLYTRFHKWHELILMKFCKVIDKVFLTVVTVATFRVFEHLNFRSVL